MSCERCSVQFSFLRRKVSFLRRKVQLYNEKKFRSLFKHPKGTKFSCPYCFDGTVMCLSSEEVSKHIQKRHTRVASKMRFRSLDIRRQCSKCQRAFCSKCLIIQPGPYGCPSLLRPGDRSYICASCLVFTSQPICRSQIARLRISDLKTYLKQQDVEITACLEKDDLVDIVMQRAAVSAAVCNCRCDSQTNPPSTTIDSVNPQININSINSRETVDVEMSNAIPNQQVEVKSSAENDSESGVETMELLSNASDGNNVNRTEPVREEPMDLSTSFPAATCSRIDVQPQPFEERMVSNDVNTEQPRASVFYFGTARNLGDRVRDALEPATAYHFGASWSSGKRVVNTTEDASAFHIEAAGSSGEERVVDTSEDASAFHFAGAGSSGEERVVDTSEVASAFHFGAAGSSGEERVVDTSEVASAFHFGAAGSSGEERVVDTREDASAFHFEAAGSSGEERVVDTREDASAFHFGAAGSSGEERVVTSEDASAFHFGAAGSSGEERVVDANEHISHGANEQITSTDLNSSEECVVDSYGERVPDELGSEAEHIPSEPSGSAGYGAGTAGNFEYLTRNLAKFFGNISYSESAGEGHGGGASQVLTEGLQTCDNVSEQPGPSRVRDVIHIKDIRSLEKLESLTVKQMKQILYDNRVDFSGCCEKVELVERLTRLWIDVHLNMTNPEYISSDDLCKVCMDAKIDCVMLRCGHMATCLDCGRVQDKCPICRVYVISVLRIFRA